MVAVIFYNDIRVKLSFGIVIFFISFTFPYKQIRKKIFIFLFSFLSFSFYPNILVENKNPLIFFPLMFFPPIFFPLMFFPPICIKILEKIFDQIEWKEHRKICFQVLILSKV